jgi:predicted nucleic acid-binding protein
MGELKHGALVGNDVVARAQRLETWVEADRRFDVLPVDETIANTWGEYEAMAAGERRKLPTPDALIAATAATHGMVLVTQDRGFEWYPDLDVLVV